MSLYNIDHEIYRILSGFDPESEDSQERLKQLKLEAKENMSSTGRYIKNIRAEAVSLKAEEAILNDKRKVLERKAERLLNYVGAFLGEGTRYNDGVVTFSWRTCPASVEIDDIALLDDKYLVEQDSKPDKAMIKSDLQADVDVSGAHLVTDKMNFSLK